jgi:DNA-binding response OmpR family regulator
MKILVVEDDRKVAGFIEQGLKEEGYVVDVAPDGDEATMLALAAERQHAVDVRMRPGDDVDGPIVQTILVALTGEPPR